MLDRSLNAIDSDAIRALERDLVPEGLDLEFKRELDLSKKEQRREAAKDISALANTVGGRILYGVDEKRVDDNSVVAGPIVPLTDGTVIETLANVLNSTIHPRPSFRFAKVDVDAGFVLVLEVHRSYSDIHMVSGYGENRYYKRGPTGVVPMTEPEIRDAYGRIYATRATIDARDAEMVEPELKVRKSTDESILVTPLYGSVGMIDPRQINIRDDVRGVYLGEGGDFAEELAFAVKIQSDGYRAVLGGVAEDADVYLAVLKNGLLHWSFNRALQKESGKAQHHNYRSYPALVRILETLVLARLIYERVGYHGPVRARYRLTALEPFLFESGSPGLAIQPTLLPARTYPSGPVDAYLRRGLAQIAKELLDPIFHAAGKVAAPWFDKAGNLVEEKRKTLNRGLVDHLD